MSTDTPLFKKIAALPGNTLLALWAQRMGDKPMPRNAQGQISRAASAAALATDCQTVAALEASLAMLNSKGQSPDLNAASALAQRAIDSTIAQESKITTLQKAVSTVASSINSVASDVVSLNNQFGNLNTRFSDLHDATRTSHSQLKAQNAQALQEIAAEINTIKSTVAAAMESTKVDDSVVTAAVTAAIASEFGRFKSAVESIPGAADVLADMTEGLGSIEVKSVKDLFGIDFNSATDEAVNFNAVANPQAPRVDDYFIWTPDILRVFNLADQDGGRSFLSNIWAGGEKGTGKTETAKQFAARTGRPYYRINFQKFTMLEDICGSTQLKDGNTEFTPGVLLQAWSTPYAVVNLDELTLADPGVLGFFNGLLEPGSVISYGGKQWRRAPGVIVVASDNTFGSGDPSGRYSGTRPQSAALLDRFGLIWHFSYLPEAEEIKAVVKHTGCRKDLAEYVLKAIYAARAKVSTGEIIDAPSIRSVISFIKTLKMLPVQTAWNATIAARQPAESAVALQAIFQSCIDVKRIQSKI